jgi:NADH dehydrogenase
MGKTDSISLPKSARPRVVVIGGGFGGINFVKNMRGSGWDVVLLDKNNFHQFQPLLYQVATCGIEPDGIIYPLRKLFEKQSSHFRFRMCRVQSIDTGAKRVVTDQGEVSYDRLVVATGSATNYFGNDELESHSTGMKDIREALDIRSRVLQNLECAAATRCPDEREALTNFVIVGAGPSGVETAGALAEFRAHILKRDYPDLDIENMKIFLVQSGDHVLKGMSDHASRRALEDLQQLGVEVLLGHRVKTYDGKIAVTDGGLELEARCLIWTAGVKGSLPDGIAEEHIARGYRLKVDQFHRADGIPDVYALGDAACMECPDYPGGHPMVAQPAMQQGKNLAKNFGRERRNQPLREFRYKDKGAMATIGKKRAVADLGSLHLGGLTAWLLWCFIHVLFLVGFRSKLLVFTGWVANYCTYDRGNRFIVRRHGEH